MFYWHHSWNLLMSDCKLKPDSILLYEKQSLTSSAYISTREWVTIEGRSFINRVNSKGPKWRPEALQRSRWSSWKQRFWTKPSEIYQSNNFKSKLTDYSEARADLIWIKEKGCFTESKALLKSVYITSVCNFMLNPSIKKVVNSSRLMVVDLRLTKPCWHGDIKEEHKCCN